MNEKSGTFELMEPPSPEALVPDSWMEPWMIAVAVLLVALLALLLLRKKKPAPFDPLAIRRAAYTEAAAALATIGAAVPAREAAVQGSLILRKYLSVAAADPALFETHEETLSRHDALNGFSEAARQAAERGFSRLAALKYAQQLPDVATVNVTADSRALLETLHHGFQS